MRITASRARGEPLLGIADEYIKDIGVGRISERPAPEEAHDDENEGADYRCSPDGVVDVHTSFLHDQELVTCPAGSPLRKDTFSLAHEGIDVT